MFVVIEVSDPGRLHLVAEAAGGGPVTVREVCRAGDLATLMSRIEDAEIAAVKARHAAAVTVGGAAGFFSMPVGPYQLANSGHEPWHRPVPAAPPLPPEGDEDDVLAHLVRPAEEPAT